MAVEASRFKEKPTSKVKEEDGTREEDAPLGAIIARGRHTKAGSLDAVCMQGQRCTKTGFETTAGKPGKCRLFWVLRNACTQTSKENAHELRYTLPQTPATPDPAQSQLAWCYARTQNSFHTEPYNTYKPSALDPQTGQST
eukprot:1137837-Pelagomonas_calceolata.AAC.1